jgi:hypothetical protein
MSGEAIFWMCLSSMLGGYIIGETARLAWTVRAWRRDRARLAAEE